MIYEEISSLDDLPLGWSDEQSPGKYTLKKQNHAFYFHYNCSPHSWKRFVFPPKQKILTATKLNENSFEITPEKNIQKKIAFLGMKPCELSALHTLDGVLLKSAFKDTPYELRRQNILTIVTNCSKASSTCFCTSMQTGPIAKSGFDLSITEIITAPKPSFLMTVGSPLGHDVIKDLKLPEATKEQIDFIEIQGIETSRQISKTLDTSQIKDVFYKKRTSPVWEKVGNACLSCANCTMVCPTCFCTTIEDTSDLAHNHAERWKNWDSCFNLDFTYMSGGSTRVSTSSRYRHWITHKLASWEDQFNQSGCVGCGRCITWCPVQIDITEVAKDLREED